MEIKMKVRQMLVVNAALGALSSHTGIRNQHVFWWLSITPKLFEDIIETYGDTRNNLVDELTKPKADDKDKRDFKDDESRIDFNEKIREIEEKEYKIEFETIRASTLFKEKVIELTPEILRALGPLVIMDLKHETEEGQAPQEEEED